MVVVDTIGIATPEAAAHLVGRTVDWLGADIPVHWHGHNDFGLATAAGYYGFQVKPLVAVDCSNLRWGSGYLGSNEVSTGALSVQ